MPERATRRLLDHRIDRVDAWSPLVDTLPFDQGVLRKLARVVRYRRDRLR